MDVPTVHVVVGTRPEAVKVAPLVAVIRRAGLLSVRLVATGQHPFMVEQALEAFGLAPDVVLDCPRTLGHLAEFASASCLPLDAVIASERSDAVVVQGDTGSTLVGAMVAFWRRVPLVHLEAGLRSGDLSAPFPEEANRRIVGVVADMHLVPTRRALNSLLNEHVPRERIVVVGNTVVDAVLEMAKRCDPISDRRLADIVRAVTEDGARMMLVTAHRRESWGPPLDRVLVAVDRIVTDHPDLHCVFPMHPNPQVRAQVCRALGPHPRIVLTEPLPYPVLCRLLARSALVLTDSGGIQEEAPSFRVPTLVLRDVTERMEAVQAGWARLVGTDTCHIVREAARVLHGKSIRPSTGNPFGDGDAAVRSAQAIAYLLGQAEPPEEFQLSRRVSICPVPQISCGVPAPWAPTALRAR